MILIPIIAAVLAAYWFYKKTNPPLSGWRRTLLFFLRSISFIVVMILLFNPILNFVQKKTSFPKIIFLNDVSDSMNQLESKHNKSEVFGQFREQIKTKFAGNNYELLDFKFAAGLNGAANSSNLSRSLQDLAKQKNLKNIHSLFLLSDGWLKDENLDILNEIDFPINVIIPDFEFNDFDLEITNIHYNKSVYKDDISLIQVNVTGNNFQGIASVELKNDDQILAAKKLNFKNSAYQELYFETVFKNPGLENFEVTVLSDSTGEINTANNTFPAAIQVLENRLKCLLVSDKLTWDESYIIDAIQADPHWETEILIKQDQFKKGLETASFQNELIDANVLILANHADLQFSRQDTDLITRFVSSGGSLLSYGKVIYHLETILPVLESKLKQQFSSQLFFTESSRKYQTFRFVDQNIAADIPPLEYYYVTPKIQAEILAKFTNDQQSPAILFHTFEKVKIIHFAFENLWKWQLRSPDNQYRKFISDLINWIGRKDSDRLIVKSDKNSYFVGETVKISAVAYDEKLIPMQDLDAKFTLFDKTNSEILSEYLLAGNQEFSLQINDLNPGKYHFQIQDKVSGLATKGEFVVSESNPESRDRGINSALLAYIAQKTNGEIITSKSIDQLTLEKAQVINQGIKRELQLYKKWYLVAIFLISFCTELFFRKRWGML